MKMFWAGSFFVIVFFLMCLWTVRVTKIPKYVDVQQFYATDGGSVTFPPPEAQYCTGHHMEFCDR